EALGLERVHRVGHDIGGWLAADMVTACPHAVDRLVLVDAMGLKPQRGEILDIFLITLAEVRARSFFDPQQVPEWQQLYGNPPTPAEAERAEEALETLVRLCWKPYMHDLRLPFLLSRLKQPTLIVWGREDAIVPLECADLARPYFAGRRWPVFYAWGLSPIIENQQVCAGGGPLFLRAAPATA